MTLTATHHPLVLPGTDGATTTPSVVFSFGMGVDSVALILRWLEEPASRDFDLADLAMVTAQVGDEFDSTRRLVEDHVLPRLRRAGVRFIQCARSQRKTTAAGDGVVVLDDSTAPSAAALRRQLHPVPGDDVAGHDPPAGGIPGLFDPCEGQHSGLRDRDDHTGPALPARHRFRGQRAGPRPQGLRLQHRDPSRLVSAGGVGASPGRTAWTTSPRGPGWCG